MSVLFAQVQKHLSKLFDNVAKMRFEADTEGNPTKSGLGMYSKEEEYVPFHQPCDCAGQVTKNKIRAAVFYLLKFVGNLRRLG